jgi:hypothetical protein
MHFKQKISLVWLNFNSFTWRDLKVLDMARGKANNSSNPGRPTEIFIPLERGRSPLFIGGNNSSETLGCNKIIKLENRDF